MTVKIHTVTTPGALSFELLIQTCWFIMPLQSAQWNGCANKQVSMRGSVHVCACACALMRVCQHEMGSLVVFTQSFTDLSGKSKARVSTPLVKAAPPPPITAGRAPIHVFTLRFITDCHMGCAALSCVLFDVSLRWQHESGPRRHNKPQSHTKHFEAERKWHQPSRLGRIHACSGRQYKICNKLQSLLSRQNMCHLSFELPDTLPIINISKSISKKI